MFFLLIQSYEAGRWAYKFENLERDSRRRTHTAEHAPSRVIVNVVMTGVHFEIKSKLDMRLKNSVTSAIAGCGMLY